MLKSRLQIGPRMTLALATLVLASAPAAFAAEGETEVSGTGATFPAKVYQQWAERYAHDTGTKVSYVPRGSSAGVKQIAAGAVDFGATDVPMSEADLQKKQLFQFPTLVGGVVPVVNLPGVPPLRLRLDAATLTAIFAGQIAHWNDKTIAALNPGLALPDLRIRRVVRADGSGTTEVFLRYLQQAAPTLAAAITGPANLPQWPGKVTPADGSSKLAAAVKATPGAIGYISSDYLARENLQGVQLRNQRGEWVQPSLESYRAAIQAVALFRNSLAPTSMLDTDGVNAWPIVTATYVVVPRSPQHMERAGRTLNFFYRSFLLGDSAVAGPRLAPLPGVTQARIVAVVCPVRTTDGRLVPILSNAAVATQLVAAR